MATQLNAVASAIPAVPVANAADATGNYVVPGSSLVAIRITNGSGGSINVTLDDVTTATPEGQGVTISPDPVFPVAAAASRYILLDRARKSRFVHPVTGRVSWTYSAATSVTVEVVAL
jgi:hypothetical protein